MAHDCGACDGTGLCQNDFHELVNAINPIADMVSAIDGEDYLCPACGQTAADPGNCSSCGGTGQQHDDEPGVLDF